VIRNLIAEIERLRADLADLRRWKALNKPLTAAMAIANSHLAPMHVEIERLQAALDEIIEIAHYPDATIARRARGLPTTDREDRLLKDYRKLRAAEQTAEEK
jgi:hypothetical protein